LAADAIIVCTAVLVAWLLSASLVLADANTPEAIQGYNDANVYRFIRPLHSGKCGDVSGWSTNNGAIVHQWDCHDGNNQVWRLNYKRSDGGNSVWEIRNRHSDKCLDLKDWSTANGAQIQQWSCHGGKNQEWKSITVNGDQRISRFVNMHSGKCLDINGASGANGARFIQWDCHGGNNQSFRVERAWIPNERGGLQAWWAWSDKYGDWVGAGSTFRWNDRRMSIFRELGSYFQYEINRLGNDYWDYYHKDSVGRCFVYMWTDLPNPTPLWSEEQDGPCGQRGNEEFEIKSQNTGLKANYTYSAYGWFTWDSEDRNGWRNFQIEAEQCGTLPFCSAGSRFDWDVMNWGRICAQNCR
jgi:hypothetical protein